MTRPRMASNDNIEVFGIASLERDLRGIANKMNKKDIAKILRPGAQLFQKEIRSQAPVRTGTLQKAVRVRVARGRASDPTATVETYFAKTYVAPKSGKLVKPYYAWFVHNGTVTSKGRRVHRKGASVGARRIRPNPFVARAFEAKVDEAARVILEKISKSVENE